MTNTTVALDPCPFCGGGARLGETTFAGARVRDPDLWRAGCGACRFWQKALATSHEAIQAWNTRVAAVEASPEPQDAKMEFPAELRDMARRIVAQPVQAMNAAEAQEWAEQLVLGADMREPSWGATRTSEGQNVTLRSGTGKYAPEVPEDAMKLAQQIHNMVLEAVLKRPMKNAAEVEAQHSWRTSHIAAALVAYAESQKPE